MNGTNKDVYMLLCSVKMIYKLVQFAFWFKLASLKAKQSTLFLNWF